MVRNTFIRFKPLFYCQRSLCRLVYSLAFIIVVLAFKHNYSYVYRRQQAQKSFGSSKYFELVVSLDYDTFGATMPLHTLYGPNIKCFLILNKTQTL